MRELMSYALIRPHFKRGHPTTGGQASPDEAGEGLDRFSGFLTFSTLSAEGTRNGLLIKASAISVHRVALMGVSIFHWVSQPLDIRKYILPIVSINHFFIKKHLFPFAEAENGKKHVLSNNGIETLYFCFVSCSSSLSNRTLFN